MATRPVSIAIMALGGQGGGVLSDWLVAAAEAHGWIAQSTSVPGVAQRTGATLYYVEVAPAADGREPVLALMPVPGDVDIVIASELMEAGRAIVRGIVTPSRTTLIVSDHRVYGITEKSALGDGIADPSKVRAAAHEHARRCVCLDMDALARETGSVISAVLLGAIAGARVLPFARECYEQAIRAAGMAVKANLAGFAAGYERAGRGADGPAALASKIPAPSSALGERLQARIRAALPAPAHALAVEGVRRALDYQDPGYAALYLERLEAFVPAAEQATMASPAVPLLAELARHLALWMTYEDVIRVADLKTRAARVTRWRAETGAAADQIVAVSEYMHPRFEELCEMLPARVGRALLASALARRLTAPMFRHGRRIYTTRITGFLMLRVLARMRRMRRVTLRYALEQARIGAWLARLARLAPFDAELALEVVRCQRLVKGYSDTHARGLAHFELIMGFVDAGVVRAAEVRRLREAAQSDEEGTALRRVAAELGRERGATPVATALG